MKANRLPILVALAAAATAARAETDSTSTVQLADGALTFEAPVDWESVPPQSRILEHELAVEPPEGSEASAARLTIMAAGGGVQQNLDRWVGQFRDAEGDAAGRVTFEVDGMQATLLDLSGTYLESAGGPFGPKTPRPGYRLVGAIIETGGVGNYFFKLVGPAEAVDPAADRFRTMLQSLKKD